MRIAETEMSILGILIRHPELIRDAAEQIRANDFADVAPRQAFEAIKALYLRGEAVDIVSVDAELSKRSGNLVDTKYLIECAENGFNTSALKTYIGFVRSAAERRRVIALANRLAEVAADEETELGEPVAKAVDALKDLSRAKGEWKPIADVLLDSYEDIERMSKGEIVPCTSGLSNLDDLTGGFFPGEMTILAARPSVGKTAFGLFMAISSALKGKNVAFVSAEMISQQIGKRALSDAGDINSMRLRNPQYLQVEDWAALSDAMVKWGELPMQFLFEREVEEIVTQARRLRDRRQMDMLMVDYLQLLTTRRRFESDWLRIGYISQELKALSTELEIPVIALAQVSREGAKTGMPGLDSLRGSGNMEQDADNAIILHRVDDPADKAMTEEWRGRWRNTVNTGHTFILLNVAKQRQGMCGVVAAAFDAAHMRYAPIE